jgi:hypothetical protein
LISARRFPEEEGMRVGRLGSILLVALVACGPNATQSVSSGSSGVAAAQGSASGNPVDATAIAARWRVVKAASEQSMFEVGEVVEFDPGGSVRSGTERVDSSLTWTLEGDQLQLVTATGPVSYSVSIDRDVLRLVDAQSRTDVLRRFAGPAQPAPPASAVLEEARFYSLLGSGAVETATLTQRGKIITVTGVYVGGSGAERYAVTLRRCELVRSLDAAFRAKGVLTDGLSPSDAEC